MVNTSAIQGVSFIVPVEQPEQGNQIIQARPAMGTWCRYARKAIKKKVWLGDGPGEGSLMQYLTDERSKPGRAMYIGYRLLPMGYTDDKSHFTRTGSTEVWVMAANERQNTFYVMPYDVEIE